MSDPSQTNVSSEPILIEKFNDNIDEAYNFYSNEISRLFQANSSLLSKLQHCIQQKKQLADKIYELEKNLPNSSHEDKKKRLRRCANQIKRQFVCKADKCGKSYGSEGSLLQHIKIKHADLSQFKSQMKEESQEKEK